MRALNRLFVATAAALAVGALGAVALLAAPAAAAAGPSWAGTWQTSRGPLVVTVSGSAITGTFGYADSHNEPIGHISGSQAGATISGKWSYEKADFAPMDHGSFTITMAVQGGKATFSGKQVFEANGSSFDWTGSCTAGACAADTTAPVVKALPASGKPGAAVALRYQLFDSSEKASEKITVLRGATVLWRKVVPLHGAAVAGGTFGVSWKAPAKAGTGLRFTVEARDAAGNTARSTAAITLR